MKLILYSAQDEHAKAFKLFLESNKIIFREIPTPIAKNSQCKQISSLKIIRNHSICIIDGFNELMLNQLLEDIKKYKPRIEI